MRPTLPARWMFSMLLAGCAFGPEKSSIADQLEPSGTCWDVDLSDGLDETSTSELHALFDCLNRTSNLASFEALDAAMDSENRDGETIGVSLIQLGNHIAEDDFSLLGLAGAALSSFNDNRAETELFLRGFVELAYGTPFSEIDADADVYAADGLGSGLMYPAMVFSGQVASDLLDGGSSMHESVNALRNSTTLESAACFVSGIQGMEDNDIEGAFEHPLLQAAEAWQLAAGGDNNRWVGATGNSIRDLIDEVIRFRSDTQFREFREPLYAILSDEQVRQSTKQALTQAAESGDFVHMLQQLQYLSTVDVSGNALDAASTADSALQVGARLLHTANQPMYCDLLLFDVDIDNMATRILKRLADFDSGQVEAGLSFFVGLLDGDITPAILRAAASSGICSGFTPELLADLDVLERLNDAEVGNLVIVMHRLLDAVYREGQVNRLPELVNIISVVHTQGLMPPIEEILRDLHETNLFVQAPYLFPYLLDPSSLSTAECNPGSTPMSWDDLWSTMRDLSSGDPLPTENVVELLERTSRNDNLWILIDRLALLALHPETDLHELMSASGFFEPRRTNDSTDLTSRFFEDTVIWNTVLMTVESNDIQRACMGTPGESNQPVGFMSDLILSDTVTLMLQTLDLVLNTLDNE